MLTDDEVTVLLLLAHGAPVAVRVGSGADGDPAAAAAAADTVLGLACCGNSWPAVAALCCVLRPGDITRVRSAGPWRRCNACTQPCAQPKSMCRCIAEEAGTLHGTAL